MADSSFSLSKVLGFLKRFLSTMASPLQGFDMRDVKVNESNGEFSVLYQFNSEGTKVTNDKDEEETSKDTITDINSEALELDVLIKVLDAKEVFAPLLNGLNKLTPDNVMGDNKILDIFLGVDRGKNSLEIQKGKGLLGEDLTKVPLAYGKAVPELNYVGKTWTWGYIVTYFKYALECQSPGKAYGAIENITYENCQKLIPEYLVKQGVIDNGGEVKLDSANLVRPLALRIQSWLIDYYNSAIKKYVNQDSSEEESSTDENADNGQNPENEQNQEGQNPPENTQEQPTKEGEPVNTNPNSSKHIDVTLQKIAGTTTFDMTMIKANYDPSLVLADMDEIVSQPEFIESLPEEPTTYSIDVDDDGFDIETCEGDAPEADPCASLCEVFKAGIRAYRNLYIIHWMSKGNDMMKLHVMAEDMYEELVKEIDTLGELLVEKQGTVPQLDFACDYVPVQDYDFQSGLTQIESLVNMYIDTIDYAYCNQDSDVQSVFDEWLRYWKKQTKYFLERQEI